MILILRVRTVQGWYQGSVDSSREGALISGLAMIVRATHTLSSQRH